MHGFLNFFTAAAIAWCASTAGGAAESVGMRRNGQSPDELKAQLLASVATCLLDSELAHWHFSDDALDWVGGLSTVHISESKVAELRSKFALGFGSCSFEEPIEELRQFELL
jgi:hypothetical protein